MKSFQKLKTNLSNFKSKIQEKLSDQYGKVKNVNFYSMHDFTTSPTIANGQIVSGKRNVDNKREIARNNYLNLFENSFKNKSISDIIDYITGKNLLKNFSNAGEIEKLNREIESLNLEEKSVSVTPKTLTIDDIYNSLGVQCLVPVDGKFTGKTLRAYHMVANRTQAIYRAVSFIKTNMQAIYNKCELDADETSPNSKQKLSTLLNIVETYINTYSSYTDFYLTDLQNSLIYTDNDANAYNEDDVLSRGYEIAQIRCTNLVRANLESDKGLVDDAKELLKKADQNAKDFVDLVSEAQRLKEESISYKEQIENINNQNEKNQQIADVIKEAYKSIDKSCEKEIEKAWIGTGADKDIASKAYERQKQIINALRDVANDFNFFEVVGESSEKAVTLLSFDGADATFTPEDCIISYNDNTKIEGLNGLQEILVAYQNDDELSEKQDILKTFTFNTQDGKIENKILTNEQVQIMNSLYQKLKAYYDANGNLKDFGYKSATHSIPETTLDNINAIFENDFKNNSSFENLTSEQVDALHMFIRNFEPVKGLFSKNEIVQYEIDSKLIDFISKEANCKNVMDFINLKAVEKNLKIANSYIKRNKTLANNIDIKMQANNAGAENDLSEARNIKQETEKLLIKQEAISKEVQDFKDDANKIIKNIADSMIVPSYQELSITEEINLDSAQEIENQEDNRQTIRLNLTQYTNTLAENSDKAKIVDIYKKFLTSKQKTSLTEFIKEFDMQSQNLKTKEEDMYIEK